ncbi:MAG: hypothetical protein NTNFB02_11230 [Nitrospira sp.]
MEEMQQHIPNEQVEQCPDDGGKAVPEGDIKPGGPPAKDRAEHLNRDAEEHRITQNVEGPLELGVLHADHVPHE